MAELKTNPNYNASLPISTTNQPYVFADPNQVINPQTGQTNAITSESLKPAIPIEIPKIPTDTINYSGIVAGGSALTDSLRQISVQQDTTPDWLKEFLRSSNEPTSLMPEYVNLETQYGIAEKEQGLTAAKTNLTSAQKELDLINAQLRDIAAQTQVQSLQLEKNISGGPGLTAGSADYLNKQQAEVSRQAAIKSLPYQAQALVASAKISSAQGDVETAQNALFMAQDKVKALFSIKEADEERQYNYRKDLRDKVWDYLNTKEQQQIQIQQKEDDRKFELYKYNLSLAQSLANTAIENGQGGLATQIMGLDPNSETFTQDIAGLQGKIVNKALEQQEFENYITLKKLGIDQASLELQRKKLQLEIDQATKDQVISLANINGQGTTGVFKPDTDLTATQKQKVNTVVAGLDLINQAEKLYNEAIGTEYTGFGSGVLARLKGLGRITGGLFGVSEKWKAYQNFLDSNRAPIAKGIKGEVGNLAENEQKNALKSFPGAFSSPYEARVAFEAIRSQAQSSIRALGSLDIIQSSPGEETTSQLNLSTDQLQELKDLGLIQ